MKRLGTYLLLFVVIFSNLPVSQLRKFRMLLKHFHEHQLRNPQIGFVDYLSMHYWGKDINDNDDDCDQQLPFKKDSVIVYLAYLQFRSIRIDIVLPPPPSIDIHPDINEPFQSDAHLHSLFRPPQFIA